MNSRSTPMAITISFQPIKLKLFRSKRNSLLVIEGICINGSLNRIMPGHKALIHIRPTSSLATPIDNIDRLARALVLNEESIPHLNKGCWVDINSTNLLVLKAHANIERNRRGDRLIECTDVLALQEQDDESVLPIDTSNEYNTYIVEEDGESDPTISINLKTDRHVIFANWLVDTYSKEVLSRGSGVLDVAGGKGVICGTLTKLGVPCTLLDPNPRCNPQSDGKKFGVIPLPLNGDGGDLTARDDDVGCIVRNCSLICGLHPDQATEPIVTLALKLNVPFAIAPCCVMPSLFPNRVQRRYNNDPVRSYSAFVQYLLDMAPGGEEFKVGFLPFVGRNKVIYR